MNKQPLRQGDMEIYGQGRYMSEVGAELLDEVHEPPFYAPLVET
jgi:hypothetical protein